MAARIMPGLGIRAGYNPSESGWGAALNEDLLLLSAAVQLSVKSMTTTLPPTGSAGDIYIVKVGAVDEGLIAVWDNGDWEMIPPNRGWLAYVVDLGKHHMFNDTDWQVFGAGLTLPSYSIADDGKVLTIDPSGALVWQTPSGGGGVTLPTFSVSEAGQILGVDNAGNLIWKFQRKASVVTNAGTSITLTNAHLSGDITLKLTSSSAVTVTIPSGLTGVDPVTIIGCGTGIVTIVNGAGVVLNSADSRNKLRSRYSSAVVIPMATDDFILAGDIIV